MTPFDSFRSWYPRKEAWADAKKAFNQVTKAGKLPAMVILKVAIKCQQFQRKLKWEAVK